VDFSADDLNSHARGYPALLDITNGGPVGALVFAHNAVAGRIWTRDGIFPLTSFTVVGQNILRLYPAPQNNPVAFNPIYDRQARIFGKAGQQLLRKAKVGIIGLGGAGALINEWLAHLGVGEIVGVDFDKVDPSNQPRIPGSTLRDAQVFFSTSSWKSLQRLGRWLAKYKVHVARRVATKANPHVRYQAIVGNITQREVALMLKDVDYLFLCADSAQSRLVFNALVYQYLLPGIQVGSKVFVVKATGAIGDIFTATRPVLPFAGGGCLLCNDLISAARLQEEALSEEERQRQTYVDEASVAAPSVITLNAVACAPAANEFLNSFFGLHRPQARKGYLMNFSREREWRTVECRAEETCLHCGASKGSVFARGDGADLPCT